MVHNFVLKTITIVAFAIIYISLNLFEGGYPVWMSIVCMAAAMLWLIPFFYINNDYGEDAE